FNDSTGHIAANRHGISLIGVWGTHFGWMRGNNLRGDLINLPTKLYRGTNPDPYAVTFCQFDGVEANFCGFAFNNQNYLGFNGSIIDSLRVVVKGESAEVGFY